MAGNTSSNTPWRSIAPRAGTADAEAFVAALAAQVPSTEAKVAEEFLGLDEVEAFSVKKGMNSLTSQIRKENGSDRVFTKPPQTTKGKSKKKRLRVAI